MAALRGGPRASGGGDPAGAEPAGRAQGAHRGGAALAGLGRSEEAVELLRDTRREVIEAGNLGWLDSLDVSLGVAMLGAGQPAAGVRWLEESIRRHLGRHNDFQPTRAHVGLGEFYLALVRGEARMPRREWLRQPGFAVRATHLAARKARHHLDEAVRPPARPLVESMWDRPGRGPKNWRRLAGSRLASRG